jgi:uncharacterized membrane protein YeaQ/YmgE (transglycosylase-associated protein family)
MGVFNILGWILFGLIVGAIARLLLPGKQAMGWIMTILLGVVGSFVGGAISWLIFGTEDGRVNPAGFLMSVVGAFLLVWIYSRLAASGKVPRKLD